MKREDVKSLILAYMGCIYGTLLLIFHFHFNIGLWDETLFFGGMWAIIMLLVTIIKR